MCFAQPCVTAVTALLFVTLGGAYRLWLCCKPHLKTCFTASLTSCIYRSALWNTIAAINLGMYGPPTQRRAADHNKTFTAAQSWGVYGAGGHPPTNSKTDSWHTWRSLKLAS